MLRRNAVDISDVDNPDSNGDLSWPGTGRWPINQSGRLRAPRYLARHRKQNEKLEKNSLHALLPRVGQIFLENSFNFSNCLRIILRAVI